MKTKSLLSIISAGVIVATAGISFAAWDTLTATKDTTFTIADNTTIAIPAGDLTWTGGASGVLDDQADITAPFEITAKNAPASATMTLTATDVKVDGQAVPTGTIVISFEESNSPLSGGVDSAVEASNSYTAKAHLDTSATDVETLAGKTVTFTINAELKG